MSQAYSLPAELTIYTIGETHARCLSWLAQDGAADKCLQVDARDVAEVDAAGIQLLMSLSNTLVAEERELKLVAPSELLSAACLALGADSLISPDDRKGPSQ
ncbi:MAG TPA: STAS domain-containing protein [Aquabacterium sp.]|uniref:STAS domain-containing protein n=1 Tax=Aquabacterium sp. TaxID=1872578 RepID=UPI002E2F76E2|nr:STAS domain-containing protein [Aquabacterium sp.]HEX5357560.1 STAS domain-containing protein [Aquabacterium sp.]